MEVVAANTQGGCVPCQPVCLPQLHPILAAARRGYIQEHRVFSGVFICSTCTCISGTGDDSPLPSFSWELHTAQVCTWRSGPWKKGEHLLSVYLAGNTLDFRVFSHQFSLSIGDFHCFICKLSLALQSYIECLSWVTPLHSTLYTYYTYAFVLLKMYT